MCKNVEDQFLLTLSLHRISNKMGKGSPLGDEREEGVGRHEPGRNLFAVLAPTLGHKRRTAVVVNEVDELVQGDRLERL